MIQIANQCGSQQDKDYFLLDLPGLLEGIAFPPLPRPPPAPPLPPPPALSLPHPAKSIVLSLVFCLSRRELPPREYLLSLADRGIYESALGLVTDSGRGMWAYLSFGKSTSASGGCTTSLRFVISIINVNVEFVAKFGSFVPLCDWISYSSLSLVELMTGVR